MNLWFETFRKAWHIGVATALLAMAGGASAQRLSLDGLQAQINAKIALSDLAACAANDTVVRVGTVWKCKSTLPRIVDNGDGTVTDNLTGLMWEKKQSCGHPDALNAHCVENLYDWSSPGNALQTGSLFTDFLPLLNGSRQVLPTACYANRCDWRLPTASELQTLRLSTSVSCAAPCIDPVFGPSNEAYWSSSTTSSGFMAWLVAFYGRFSVAAPGGYYAMGKSQPAYARAVRSAVP